MNDSLSRARSARRKSPARLAAHAGVLACLLAASCTSVGGKKVTVELATAPEVGADAYVIPQDRWFAKGKDLYRSFEAAEGPAQEEARASLFAWLDAWLVRVKRTPVEVTIVACQHVFLAARERELEYVEFDPLELRADAHGTRKLVMEFPRPESADGSH